MPKVRGDYLTRFKPKPDSLASKPVSVFLPKDIDAKVRAIPNRSQWLRETIAEKLSQESDEGIPNEPLIREAIANSIALKREALAAEKKRLSKADQSLIERWSFEIKQLEELL